MADSSLPLSRRYLKWKEAIQLRVDGDLYKLKAVISALEEVDGTRELRLRLGGFLANAETLSKAPMEPPRDGGGMYQSFDAFLPNGSSSSLQPITGALETQPLSSVILAGINLNIGGLQQDLETAKEVCTIAVKPFPDFDSLEKTLGFKISNEKKFGR